MKDFNSITTADESAAKAKFIENGFGVPMGAFNKNTRLDDEDTAKWADLINEGKWSVAAIKHKALETANRINNTCNDELFGDLTVAFSMRDNRNKLIKVTHLEIYTFLRAAYRERIETANYKAKAKQVKELTAFINQNKSTEDKLKEATEQLAKLNADGITSED